MKKGLRHLLTLLIAVTVLVSGNGVVLAIHTCLATSDKNVSLFKEKSCCESEKKECEDERNCSSIESKCCTSEITYKKVSAPFLLNKSSEIIPPVNVLPSIFLIDLSSLIRTTFNSIPPPLLSEGLPLRHCQLLI